MSKNIENPDPTTSARPARSGVRRLVGFTAIAAVLASAAACGTSANDAQNLQGAAPHLVTSMATARHHGEHHGRVGTTSAAFSLVLHITNNSSRTLHYMSDELKPDENVSPDPAGAIAPNGGTDTIFLTSTLSSGAEVRMTYRVDGTEETVNGFFQVPPAGSNTAACSNYKKDPGCSIDGGYHPNAHWVIRPSDVPTVSLGAAGSEWTIGDPSGANGPQLLEVNKAVSALLPHGHVDTWQLTNDGSTVQANEVWTYQPSAADAGWGELVNKDYNQCLENDASRVGSVIATGCVDGATNQMWKTVPGRTIGASLQNESSNTYLGVLAQYRDFGNGAGVDMMSTPSDLTDWSLYPAP